MCTLAFLHTGTLWGEFPYYPHITGGETEETESAKSLGQNHVVSQGQSQDLKTDREGQTVWKVMSKYRWCGLTDKGKPSVTSRERPICSRFSLSIVLFSLPGHPPPLLWHTRSAITKGPVPCGEILQSLICLTLEPKSFLLVQHLTDFLPIKLPSSLLAFSCLMPIYLTYPCKISNAWQYLITWHLSY